MTTATTAPRPATPLLEIDMSGCVLTLVRVASGTYTVNVRTSRAAAAAMLTVARVPDVDRALAAAVSMVRTLQAVALVDDAAAARAVDTLQGPTGHRLSNSEYQLRNDRAPAPDAPEAHRPPGLSYEHARALAPRLGGVEIHARYSAATGRWLIGGWSEPEDVHLVVSTDLKTVLADDPALHPYPAGE